MPTIPTQISGPSSEETEEHLVTERDGAISKTTWPLIGVAVFHESNSFPSQSDFAKNTPTLVFHGHSGYTIDQFSEFFIDNTTEPMELRIGSVEISFGDATPLAVHLFNAQQDEHVHGEWSFIRTVRIHGVAATNAEVVLLNALQRYAERFEVQPRVVEIAPVTWISDEEYERIPDRAGPDPVSITADLEPLRCFYYAAVNAEPAASCIQYYRVLEYYAFFSLQSSLSAIRHNNSVSERDFLLEVSKMLSRDEKGPLLKLVSNLADPSILRAAVEERLIQSQDATALGTALYDFRNSIVHAKYDQRSTLVVDSVTTPGRVTLAWKSLLERMAKAAIRVNAKKLAT
jgi:hypothetical protein